jgi:hypothetical protein
MAKKYIGENFTLNKVLLAIHQNRIESNLLKFSMKSDGIIVYSLYGKGNWDKVKSIRWDLTKDFLGEQRKETIAEILKLINRDF